MLAPDGHTVGHILTMRDTLEDVTISKDEHVIARQKDGNMVTYCMTPNCV
jgi:hypothetical protein